MSTMISAVKDALRPFFYDLRYAIARETFAIDETFEAHIREEVRHPDWMTVMSSNLCNARCTFCQYPSHTDPKMVMTPEIHRKAIDQHLAEGGTSVLLSPNNGDPLIDPKLVENLVYARGKGVKDIQITTNGIMLRNGDLTDHIVRLVSRISISVPGFDPENYKTIYGVNKAAEVLEGVIKLAESKRAAKSNIIIELNLRIDRPLESVMHDDGMTRLKPYFDDGTLTLNQVRGEEMFDWSGLLDESMLTGTMKIKKPNLPAKRLPCNRILSDFNTAVLPDGAVRVCYCGRGSSNYGDLIIGNINEQPLSRLLLNAPHRKLLREWMEGILPPECRGCGIWQPNPYPPRLLVRLGLRLLASPSFWKRRLGFRPVSAPNHPPMA